LPRQLLFKRPPETHVRYIAFSLPIMKPGPGLAGRFPLSIAGALVFFCGLWLLDFPKPMVDDLFYTGAALNLAGGGDFSNPMLVRQEVPQPFLFCLSTRAFPRAGRLVKGFRRQRGVNDGVSNDDVFHHCRGHDWPFCENTRRRCGWSGWFPLGVNAGFFSTTDFAPSLWRRVSS